MHGIFPRRHGQSLGVDEVRSRRVNVIPKTTSARVPRCEELLMFTEI